MTNETFVAKTVAPAAEIDGTAVLMNREDGGLYGLNPVAARVWEWLQEPRTLAELVELLTGEFDVDVETAEVDLKVLLHELRGRGLI